MHKVRGISLPGCVKSQSIRSSKVLRRHIENDQLSHRNSKIPGLILLQHHT